MKKYLKMQIKDTIFYKYAWKNIVIIIVTHFLPLFSKHVFLKKFKDIKFLRNYIFNESQLICSKFRIFYPFHLSYSY